MIYRLFIYMPVFSWVLGYSLASKHRREGLDSVAVAARHHSPSPGSFTMFVHIASMNRFD